MSFIAGDNHDQRLHETVILSTKVMVESQEAMLRRIEACNESSNARVEASTASIAALLVKVVESHAQNQLQMIEMLKILANNNTNINNASICNESVVDCPVVIPDEQNLRSIPIVGGATEEEVVVNETSEGDDVKEEQVESKLSEGDDVEVVGNESKGDEIEEMVEIESSEHVEVVPSAINEEREVNQVNQEDDEEHCQGYELFKQAVFLFDWKKAKDYLNDFQTVIQKIYITKDSRMEIHGILGRAVCNHRYTFVEKFLKLVPPEKLEYVNPNDGDTILHVAAKHGGIKSVKALVKKNPNLTQIWSNNELPGVPLLHATKSRIEGRKEVVEYLCSVTRNDCRSPFSGNQGAVVLIGLISADMHGLAFSVCQRFPELVKELIKGSDDGTMPTLLQVIVERPFTFLSGSKLKWWERCIYAIIEVDLENLYNDGIHGEKQKVNLEGSGGTTKKDEENPPDASKYSHLSEQCSSTDNNRSLTKFISFNFMRYLRRVPLIKKLYDQKLMHEQVVALTKYFLEELGKETIDKLYVKGIFLKFNLLENAIKFGTTEFVLECLRVFPYLCTDDNEGDVGHTLIKLVVSERNEMVYNFRLICANETVIKLDKNNNSILHYCAELPHNRRLNVVSGAAFQMQREIQWFKWVEYTMPRRDRFIRNNNGDTAQFLFTENHKGLMKEGQKWMKDTSASCMVVAALIATVAFAAAITVPGGNIQDTCSIDNGLPVFLNENSFVVFATADALALFSSVTSVLMFLAVFTSRYSEEDFLKALPQRLILGLATLFISMASILVSFGAAFTIVLGQRFHWAPIAVSLFSCAPILLFGFLQFPLFVEMVSSTYWPTILRKKDTRIYKQYFSKIHWILYTERKQVER